MALGPDFLEFSTHLVRLLLVVFLHKATANRNNMSSYIAKSGIPNATAAPTQQTRIPQPPTAASTKGRQFWRPPGAINNGLTPCAEYQSPGRESAPNATFFQRISSAIPAPKRTLFPDKALTTSSTRKTIPLAAPVADTPGDSASEATWYGATKIPLVNLLRAQNVYVDRSPAQVGERCSDKLSITFKNPYARIVRLEYPCPIDWDDPRRIQALNRWRKAVFHQYFGAEETSDIYPGPDELEIAFQYREQEKQAELLRHKTAKQWPRVAKSAKGNSSEVRQLEGEINLETLRGPCQIALEDCGVDLEEPKVHRASAAGPVSMALSRSTSRASTLVDSVSEESSQTPKVTLDKRMSFKIPNIPRFSLRPPSSAVEPISKASGIPKPSSVLSGEGHVA